VPPFLSCRLSAAMRVTLDNNPGYQCLRLFRNRVGHLVGQLADEGRPARPLVLPSTEAPTTRLVSVPMILATRIELLIHMEGPIR